VRRVHERQECNWHIGFAGNKAGDYQILKFIQFLRYAGLAIVFLWFFVGGVGHFTMTEFFVAIMPPYVPFHLAIVYISGVFEIVLALLILWPKYRPMAGWGLFALTIAVTPANIHMWLNPELFPDQPASAYSIRLVVQVFLLAIIWWSTRVKVMQAETATPTEMEADTA
jgi:uncharacterized membrane protein